jgi:hypothetical protein
MAKVTKIVDDIDGTDATDTLEFSWGGDNYTIDLSDENADEFRRLMARYVSHATKVRHEVKPFGKRVSPVRSTSELNEIRAWAREHDFEVSSVGRIREEILTAYENRDVDQETTDKEAE